MYGAWVPSASSQSKKMYCTALSPIYLFVSLWLAPHTSSKIPHLIHLALNWFGPIDYLVLMVAAGSVCVCVFTEVRGPGCCIRTKKGVTLELSKSWRGAPIDSEVRTRLYIHRVRQDWGTRPQGAIVYITGVPFMWDPKGWAQSEHHCSQEESASQAPSIGNSLHVASPPNSSGWSIDHTDAAWQATQASSKLPLAPSCRTICGQDRPLDSDGGCNTWLTAHGSLPSGGAGCNACVQLGA